MKSDGMDRILEKAGILSTVLAHIGAVALFGTMCLTAGYASLEARLHNR